MTAQATRPCGCGCGALVVRRYLPGHDARHKSALVAQAIATKGTWAGEAAAAALIERGWESFLPLPLLRDLPIRNTRRQVRVPITQVERFLVGPDGDHHARHNCRRLTASARRVGMVHPITRLATQAAITRVAPTPSLLRLLPCSWMACPECTIDWTLDEVVESNESRKASYLAAIEATTPVTGKARKAKATPSPRPFAPFEVTPDPIPCLILPLIHATFPFLLIPATTRQDLILDAA